MPSVLVLVGPTAVGKTAAALQLAERLGGEIVSLDSRSFYRGMDIGTAKPTPTERARVPHHLVDIADPRDTITLVELQRLAGSSIAAIVQRRRLPILVGGTGQYVRAVLTAWNPPAVAPNEIIRSALTKLAAHRGGAWLHTRLASLDPVAGSTIDARNVRRTIRALEVILVSGRRFSEQRGLSPASYRVMMIGLQRPRRELYARVDARIDQMWVDGLLEETRHLLDAGVSADLPAMSAIGYAQCVQVIRGTLTVDAAVAEMRRLTRLFIRRQSNWFKEKDPAISWFDAARPDVVDAVETCVRAWLSSGDTQAGIGVHP